MRTILTLLTFLARVSGAPPPSLSLDLSCAGRISRQTSVKSTATLDVSMSLAPLSTKTGRNDRFSFCESPTATSARVCDRLARPQTSVGTARIHSPLTPTRRLPTRRRTLSDCARATATRRPDSAGMVFRQEGRSTRLRLSAFGRLGFRN